MTHQNLHPWTLDPEEAIKVQSALRERLALAWDGRPVTTVGGVDVDLEEDVARAAIVVLRYPDLTPLEGVTADAPLVFPYIPGLLAFREGPAVLAAWEKLPGEGWSVVENNGSSEFGGSIRPLRVRQIRCSTPLAPATACPGQHAGPLRASLRRGRSCRGRVGNSKDCCEGDGREG